MPLACAHDSTPSAQLTQAGIPCPGNNHFLSTPSQLTQLVDYNLMAYATALFAPFMADFKRYAKKD